ACAAALLLQSAAPSAHACVSGAERPALARRSRFHVGLMISFCAEISPSSWVPVEAAIAWLWASEYSSLNGFTSRKKISLRDSVDAFACATSRARAEEAVTARGLTRESY